MKKSIFENFNIFLIILILTSYFGLYLNIDFNILFIIHILVLSILSYKTDLKGIKINYPLLIIIIIQLIILYLMTDKGILITDSPDFYNHISISKVIADTNNINYFIDNNISTYNFIHTYPIGLYAILSYLINFSPFDQIRTGFLFISFLISFSTIIIYNIAIDLFKKKENAILSTIIFGLSAFLLMEMEQGYLTSLLAKVFLLLFFYYFYKKRYLISSLCWGITGLIYPHYFLIGLIFLILNYMNQKNKIYYIYIIGLFVGCIEISILLFSAFIKTSLLPELNVSWLLLIRGGILLPSLGLITLLSFLVIFSTKTLFNNKKFVMLSLAFLIPTFLLFLAFVFNYLFKYFLFFELKQVYMVIKYGYLIIIPLSFLFAKNYNKKNKKLIKGFVIIYILYFVAYPLYFNQSTKWDVTSDYFEQIISIQKTIPINSTVCIDTYYLSQKKDYNCLLYDSIYKGSSNVTLLHLANSMKLLRNNWTDYDYSPTQNSTWIINIYNKKDFVEFKEDCSNYTYSIKK